MSWEKVGKAIKQVAPQLAGMLVGGQLGAVTGKLIADVLGVDNEPEEVLQAISKDPAALTKIREIELDTFKTEADILKTALVQDAITPHSTRPKIAYGSFLISALASLIAIVVWGVSVIAGDTDVNDSWPFIATVIAPFTVLVQAYMGILRDEQANKMNASNNMLASATGLVGKLFKR